MTSPTPATMPRPPAREERQRRLAGVVRRMVEGLYHYVPSPGRRGNLGALAALRRSAGKRPGDSIEACAVVERFVPADLSAELTEQERSGLYAVAALFAIHPVPWGLDDMPREPGARRPAHSFGASLRAIRWRESGEENPGVERRFIALLDADSAAVPTHLRTLLALLKPANQPVDYVQLYRDIVSWEHPSREVQRRWAQEFWAAPPQTSASGQGNGSSTLGSTPASKEE